MNSSPLTNKTLLAAQGYFELGMLEDAMAELDSLPAADAGHQRGAPDAALRLHARAALGRRAGDQPHSRAGCCPKETVGYIHAAFCLHELRRTAEAKSLLLSGPSALLNEATYHYNLGCYDAVLGNIEEAQAHLRVSFRLDKKFREFARTDPDLKPVWGSL